MILDDLIAQLIEARKEHGGKVEVFTNGEHGFDDIKELDGSMVGVGTAHAELPEDFERFGIEDDTIVVHIGGY